MKVESVTLKSTTETDGSSVEISFLCSTFPSWDATVGAMLAGKTITITKHQDGGVLMEAREPNAN